MTNQSRERRNLNPNRQTVFNDQNAKQYTKRSSPRRNLNPNYNTIDADAAKARAAQNRVNKPTAGSATVEPTKPTQPTKPASTGGRSGGMHRTNVGTKTVTGAADDVAKAAAGTADDAANAASRGRIGTLLDKFKGVFNKSSVGKAASAAEATAKRAFFPTGMGKDIAKLGGKALKWGGVPLTGAQLALYSSDAGAGSDIVPEAGTAEGFRQAGNKSQRDAAETANAVEVARRAQEKADAETAAIDAAKSNAPKQQVGGGSPLTSVNAQTGDVRVNGNAGFVDESGVPQDATKTMQSEAFDPNAQFQPGQEGFDGMTKASVGDRLGVERELRGLDENDNLPGWATRNKDLAMKDSIGMRQGIWNDAGKFVGLAADYNVTKPQYKTADLQQRLAEQRQAIGAQQDLNLAKGVGLATPYIGKDPANQYKTDMAADPTGRTWRARQEASETALNYAKAASEGNNFENELKLEKYKLDVENAIFDRKKFATQQRDKQIKEENDFMTDYSKMLEDNPEGAKNMSGHFLTDFDAAGYINGTNKDPHARAQGDFVTRTFLNKMAEDSQWVLDILNKKLNLDAGSDAKAIFSKIKADGADLWGLLGGREFEVEGGWLGIGGQDMEFTGDQSVDRAILGMIQAAHNG